MFSTIESEWKYFNKKIAKRSFWGLIRPNSLWFEVTVNILQTPMYSTFEHNRKNHKKSKYKQVNFGSTLAYFPEILGT